MREQYENLKRINSCQPFMLLVIYFHVYMIECGVLRVRKKLEIHLKNIQFEIQCVHFFK